MEDKDNDNNLFGSECERKKDKSSADPIRRGMNPWSQKAGDNIAKQFLVYLLPAQFD